MNFLVMYTLFDSELVMMSQAMCFSNFRTLYSLPNDLNVSLPRFGYIFGCEIAITCFVINEMNVYNGGSPHNSLCRNSLLHSNSLLFEI